MQNHARTTFCSVVSLKYSCKLIQLLHSPLCVISLVHCIANVFCTEGEACTCVALSILVYSGVLASSTLSMKHASSYAKIASYSSRTDCSAMQRRTMPRGKERKVKGKPTLMWELRHVYTYIQQSKNSLMCVSYSLKTQQIVIIVIIIIPFSNSMSS